MVAQEKKDSLRLQFHFKFDNTSLKTNQSYISKQQDTLQIDAIRFYVSDIQIQFADDTLLKSDTNHLVDLEIPASQEIPLSLLTKKAIQQINFSIGVDSLASVSGALSGDLDPAKGMYWAWQSGYINMKIEGKSASCKTRKNQFQFHLGGYLKPNNALRTIVLKPNNTNTINIAVDLADFFSEVSLSQINSVMIPGKRGMQLADTSVKMFAIE
jgi:molybdopterin-binding protein